MKIYVPSRGRAAMLGAKHMTITYIKGRNMTYVVPPAEETAYREALRRWQGEGYLIDVITNDSPNIAGVRWAIGLHAHLAGEKKFLMVDDDLKFSVRAAVGSWHLRDAMPEDIDLMLLATERALDSFAHVSVSPRQGNNNGPPGDLTTAIETNGRTLRYLAYRTREFLSVEHNRVVVMEDFDVNLQLLEAGHQNMVMYWWANDQSGGTGMTGGCSSYRSLEAHNFAAHRLKELHPDFVTLRQKKNKTGPAGLRDREEVTIQWKRAYQSSQRVFQHVD